LLKSQPPTGHPQLSPFFDTVQNIDQKGHFFYNYIKDRSTNDVADLAYSEYNVPGQKDILTVQ